MSRATYANFFAVVGTIYGIGDGSSTFSLPDFRDRALIGAATDVSGTPMTSVSGAPLQTGGSASHALSVADLPAHTHDMTHTHEVDVGQGLGLSLVISNGLLGSPPRLPPAWPTPTNTGSAGSGSACSLRQPFPAIP